MADLKVGIVGLGWAAGAHIETFKSVEGATVAAVCSRQQRDEAELEAQYGLPMKAYTDFEAMLDDPEIDIIDICTPPPFHPEQALAAAGKGKHLLIEKPIALKPEDARAMRAAIQTAGVKACVCFEVRFCKQFTLAKSVVDQGLLGDLHFAEVDYYHGIGPWYGQFEWNVKKDFAGSSLLSAGCHALDSLLFLMDGKVEEVTTYATNSKSEMLAPYEYKTTSVTILKFAGGQAGKVTSSIDCLQPYYFHLHLLGSEGSLLDNRFYSHKLTGMVKDRWSKLETEMIDSGDVNDHPYQPQFQGLVDSINNDTIMPLTDFETAYESHRVIYAADLSAEEGRPVKLSEMD